VHALKSLLIALALTSILWFDPDIILTCFFQLTTVLTHATAILFGVSLVSHSAAEMRGQFT
jgi:hypothetical protein